MMILRMTAVTALYVILTALLWKRYGEKKITASIRILIGVVYGLCSVLSTHFGIDYGDMMLNVRDIGPLAAGLYFDPVSGIIAGLIGGIERFIAGTYWGVGSYTRVACSVSTCLAGFVAALMRSRLFYGKKPSEVYAFFMGAVMEVFHMYVVFITHRSDMSMALHVVKICAPPMIIFTGLGLAGSSLVLRVLAGEWRNPFRRTDKEEISVSQKFQTRLFAVTLTVLLVNMLFSFGIQTESARQAARRELQLTAGDVTKMLEDGRKSGNSQSVTGDILNNTRAGSSGTVDLTNAAGRVLYGPHKAQSLPKSAAYYREAAQEKGYFAEKVFGDYYLGRMDDTGDGWLLTMLPAEEVYSSRDEQAYESALANILLFTVIYMLIALLVQSIVVRNLKMVNKSLGKITGGNLNEVVNVRDSSEFASLSDDINQTVDVLKGYIDAAEKRIEQELELARTIQDAALPKNFAFPRHDFEIYATMDPAKEVGGDFYDFFFVGKDRLAMVIADVSGKGIPAALFMMRAKTGIRSLAESGTNVSEIMFRANNMLCEGNNAEMFVTAWIGIIDLTTGVMQCANAGHEYPVIRRNGGEFEYLRDRHSLALAAMEGVRYKEYSLELRPGDKLFVYTDGIPEAINEQVEQYGEERLLRILNRVGNEKMEQMLPAVRKNLAEFCGNADQFDDVTMLGFSYTGQETT